MAKKGTSFNKFFKDFWDGANKKITVEQRAVADLFFNGLKRDVIDKIRNDKISQELTNHTAPSPILDAPGSIFGFLGLVEGQEPVEEIINIVERIMTYKLSRRLIRGGLKLTIKVPDKKDFRTDDLVLQWEGGYSVVDAIEKGLSGLTHYISTKEKPYAIAYSRSGDGVQVKTKVRDDKYQPRPWISLIFQAVKDQAKTFR